MCSGKSLQFPVGWRIHPINTVIGESEVTRTGCWPPSDLKKKKQCKPQSYVKQCVLRATRHTTRSSIFVGPQTDQTVWFHMQIG